MKNITLLGLFISTALTGLTDTLTFRWMNPTGRSTKYFDIPIGKVAKPIAYGGLFVINNSPRYAMGIIHEGNRISCDPTVPELTVTGPVRMYFVGADSTGSASFVTLEITDQKTPPSGVTMKDE